jgi:hypothetical protein
MISVLNLMRLTSSDLQSVEVKAYHTVSRVCGVLLEIALLTLCVPVSTQNKGVLK